MPISFVFSVLVVVGDSAQLWTVQGSLPNSLRMKGTRQHVYFSANKSHGYYSESGSIAEYSSNGDLAFHVVFKSEIHADEFQDAMLEFESEPFSLSGVTALKSKGGNVTNSRVLRADYKSHPVDGSPAVTASVSVVSGITDPDPPSDDLLLHQSIETHNYLLGAERAHMYGTKEGAPKAVKKNGNNLLALSRDLHGYLDALGNLSHPLIRVSTQPPIGACESDGNRVNVPVVVECLDATTANNVRMRLKDGAREETNKGGRQQFIVSVAVVDGSEFRDFVEQKYLATTEMWKAKGLV